MGQIVRRVILLAFIIFCYCKLFSFGTFMFFHFKTRRQNFLVYLHINYGYTSILVQIGEPIAIFGTSAIPIEKKCVGFALPDAVFYNKYF